MSGLSLNSLKLTCNIDRVADPTVHSLMSVAKMTTEAMTTLEETTTTKVVATKTMVAMRQCRKCK